MYLWSFIFIFTKIHLNFNIFIKKFVKQLLNLIKHKLFYNVSRKFLNEKERNIIVYVF
jgi:hypothetical protein